MTKNKLDQQDNSFVSHIVDTFSEQPLPPRPSNTETVRWISVNQHPVGPTLAQNLNRRNSMRLVTSLTAVIASLALLFFLWPVQNGMTFGQIVERMAAAKSVRFSISEKRSDGPEHTGQASAQGSQMRIEWSIDGRTSVNIIDYENSRLVSFSDSSDVTVHKLPDSAGFDFVQRLQKIKDSAVKSVSGRENTVPNSRLFEFKEEGAKGRLWCDNQSGLPVRIEMTSSKKLGGGQTLFSDFEWNPKIDATLFGIPKNRKVVQNYLLAGPVEEDLIGAFQIRQAFSDAPYPENFLSNDAGLTIGRLAYDHKLSPAENSKRQLETLAPFLTPLDLTQAEGNDAAKLQRRIDFLCMKADQWDIFISKHGGWVGTGVQPGEKKPLCWWQLPGKGIRVLYADLTIRDAETAPKN